MARIGTSLGSSHVRQYTYKLPDIHTREAAKQWVYSVFHNLTFEKRELSIRFPDNPKIPTRTIAYEIPEEQFSRWCEIPKAAPEAVLALWRDGKRATFIMNLDSCVLTMLCGDAKLVEWMEEKLKL